MSQSDRRGIVGERVRSTIVSVRDSAKPNKRKRPQGVENQRGFLFLWGTFFLFVSKGKEKESTNIFVTKHLQFKQKKAILKNKKTYLKYATQY